MQAGKLRTHTCFTALHILIPKHPRSKYVLFIPSACESHMLVVHASPIESAMHQGIYED